MAKKFERLARVNEDAELVCQLKVIEKKAEGLSEASKLSLVYLRVIKEGDLFGEYEWNLSKKIKTLSERLEATIERVKETPERVKDNQTWANCENLAKQLEKDLNASMRTIWTNFVDQRTQNRVGVLSAFKGLAQCRRAILDLEHKEREARDRRGQLPDSDEDIQFIIQLDKEMTELIDGIGIKNEPEEMIEFLKRCASTSGVPLDELTDERLEWLRSKNFGDSLKIRG